MSIINPFRFAHSPGTSVTSRYNIGVLWTIPLEWMGSMLVFIVVLGISKAKTWVKISILCLLIHQAHQRTLWVVATFLSGVLLAELSFIYARPLESSAILLRRVESKENLAEKTHPKWRSGSYQSLFLFLFILGLYVGSHPVHGWHQSPGYHWMIRHLPTAYEENKGERASFWPCVGAFLIVFSLDMAPFLQRIFTTSIAQYLGEVSYAFYVVHIQVNYTFGSWLVPRCMDITGGWSNGTAGFVSGMALAGLVQIPVTFWAADVFSRLVDERSVRFARWVCIKSFTL